MFNNPSNPSDFSDPLAFRMVAAVAVKMKWCRKDISFSPILAAILKKMAAVNEKLMLQDALFVLQEPCKLFIRTLWLGFVQELKKMCGRIFK